MLEGPECVPYAARTLVDLPNSVLTSIMEWTVVVANPGQIIKMALACRALLRATAEAEGFWERLCVRHGWSRPPQRVRALPLPGASQGASTGAAGRDGASSGGGAAGAAPQAAGASPGGPSGVSPLELDPLWFRYYCDRMAARRNVRRFMKLYVSFLSRPSGMALLPGASPEQLAAAEARLGVALPPELWELYRFRAGQAAGAFVTFADDMRLLALDELVLERPTGLADLRARLQALGRPAPTQLERPGGQGLAGGHAIACGSGYGGIGGGGGGGGEAGAVRAEGAGAGDAAACVGGWGGGGAVAMAGAEVPPPMRTSVAAAGGSSSMPRGAGIAGMKGAAAPSGEANAEAAVLVVAANGSNSRRLLVALDGQVYLSRGVSIVFFAPSVSSMLQKLLT